MSNLTEKYADSIAAGRALEGGVWAFALTLAKDVQANDGIAREATEALKEAGITSTSGEPYSQKWIEGLIQLGKWNLDLLEAGGDFHPYPARRVMEAGRKHQWDAEAMLLTLKSGKTFHQILNTSPLGKPNRDALLREADRLTAADRAALATALVSETEVQEAILRSEPMAREQFVIVGGEIARQSVERSERRAKETFPSHAASEAADEIGQAANHLNSALAEIIQWGVTVEDDRLRRVQSALTRVERATTEINEALGRTASV